MEIEKTLKIIEQKRQRSQRVEEWKQDRIEAQKQRLEKKLFDSKANREEAERLDEEERAILRKGIDKLAEKHAELRRMKKAAHDNRAHIKRLHLEVKLKKHSEDKEM